MKDTFALKGAIGTYDQASEFHPKPPWLFPAASITHFSSIPLFDCDVLQGSVLGPVI